MLFAFRWWDDAHSRRRTLKDASGCDRAPCAPSAGHERRARQGCSWRSPCPSSAWTWAPAAFPRSPTASCPSNSSAERDFQEQPPIPSRSWSPTPREKGWPRTCCASHASCRRRRFGESEIARSSDGGSRCSRCPCGRPFGEEAVEAVRELRSKVVPEVLDTAAQARWRPDLRGHRLLRLRHRPGTWVIGLVLLLTSFPTVVFRSVVIAGTAVALNLSVGRRRVAAGARVPGGLGRRSPRLPANGHDRGLGTALPVLGAVRAVRDYQVFCSAAFASGTTRRTTTTDAATYASARPPASSPAPLIIVVIFGFARGDDHVSADGSASRSRSYRRHGHPLCSCRAS